MKRITIEPEYVGDGRYMFTIPKSATFVGAAYFHFLSLPTYTNFDGAIETSVRSLICSAFRSLVLKCGEIVLYDNASTQHMLKLFGKVFHEPGADIVVIPPFFFNEVQCHLPLFMLRDDEEVQIIVEMETDERKLIRCRVGDKTFRGDEINGLGVVQPLPLPKLSVSLYDVREESLLRNWKLNSPIKIIANNYACAPISDIVGMVVRRLVPFSDAMAPEIEINGRIVTKSMAAAELKLSGGVPEDDVFMISLSPYLDQHQNPYADHILSISSDFCDYALVECLTLLCFSETGTANRPLYKSITK